MDSNNSITISGLKVQFPYQPYECQRTFMEHVICALNEGKNAALESPTGTGKTLSLLCAALAWLQQKQTNDRALYETNPADCSTAAGNNKKNRSSARQKLLAGNGKKQQIKKPKIYFASRTHSQLRQIVRELNKTKYKNIVKVVTLASRDQLCINEDVKELPNSVMRSHKCRALRKSLGCPYYEKHKDDNVTYDNTYGNAMDIEDLVNIARKNRHCPFYSVRGMYPGADLVLLPYNYLLDPKIRKMYGIDIRDCVLIFDEAHNMEKIAEESMSMDFSSRLLNVAISEMKEFMELEEDKKKKSKKDPVAEEKENLKEMELGESGKIQSDNEAKHLLFVLERFEEQLKAKDWSIGGEAIPDIPGHTMIELLEKADILQKHCSQLCNLIDQICVSLVEQSDNQRDQTGLALCEFSNLISRVFDVDPFDNFRTSENFRLFVEQNDENNESNGDINLHYWCFNAGVAMRSLQYFEKVRSMIFASGTLAPMHKFKKSMGIPFGHTLESPHCARSEQLIVGALQKGPDGVDLSGTFECRNEHTYKNSVGEVVLNTAKLTPQGMVVFFTSFGQMDSFLEHWKNSRSQNGRFIWDQLKRQKRLFLEPTDKSEVNAMYEKFDEAVREHADGALLFAVCRGKLSEGIDFTDCHCRAVVIVGIPYPPLKDARVILKKTFLTEVLKQKRGGMRPDEWYMIDAMRAVNQALGRIIRHKDDFGAVILADSRYSGMNRAMFPSWMRSSMLKANSGNLFSSIEQFFSDRQTLLIQSQNRMIENHKIEKQRKRRGGRIDIPIGEGVGTPKRHLLEGIEDLYDLEGPASRTHQKGHQQTHQNKNCCKMADSCQPELLKPRKSRWSNKKMKARMTQLDSEYLS